MKRRWWQLGIVGLLASSESCGPQTGGPSKSAFVSLSTQPGISISRGHPDHWFVMGQTIFVPITSSIGTADNSRLLNLAATLTIRNVNQAQPIEVRSARYYDSAGKLIHDAMKQPLVIPPLGSLNLFVGESDTSGGTTPSYLIEWVAGDDVIPPRVDAVMISTAGAQGITLTATGQVIAQQHR